MHEESMTRPEEQVNMAMSEDASAPPEASKPPENSAPREAAPAAEASSEASTASPEPAPPAPPSLETVSQATVSPEGPPPPVASEVPAAEKPSTESAAIAEGSPPSGDDPAGPTEDAAAAKSPASERIKIGSQRRPDETPGASGPVPTIKGTSPGGAAGGKPAGEPVPVPSVRQPLGDDLEAEIAAAMGETGDSIMQAAASAAPREHEPDVKLPATVASIVQETVLLDLGGGAQGAVAAAKFKTPPAIGETHEVVVQGRNADDGLYELSLPGASIDVADWSQIEEGMIVEAKVTGANIGGLECNVGGIRGFIPASHVALFRVENLSEFINQQLDCVVLEAKKSKRNLVLSRRAVLERAREEERKERLTQIKPGDVVEGVVRSMREFGVFVDIGGLDGLVHVRQLSWERIKHPKEVLEEGQRIKVKIEKVNLQTGKISLLFRDLSENPWSRVEEKYAVGAQVSGAVSKIAEFGAFVKLEPGVEGLIHISELAHARVHRVGDVVKEGQEVEVKVLSVDVKAQRIGLSLKALLAAPEPQKRAEPEPEPEAEAPRKKRRNTPLKGGIGGNAGGDRFGLRW